MTPAKPPTIAPYQQLLERLETACQGLPKELKSDWFAAELFSCRSADPADYLAEIRLNIERLQSMPKQNESYNWLFSHLEQQLQALTQALFRARKPGSGKSDSTKPGMLREASLAGLHQELARHHEYERRLQENLRIAQETEHAEQQQRIMQCQQRLLRCQRAIRGIEERIRKAEG